MKASSFLALLLLFSCIKNKSVSQSKLDSAGITTSKEAPPEVLAIVKDPIDQVVDFWTTTFFNQKKWQELKTLQFDIWKRAFQPLVGSKNYGFDELVLATSGFSAALPVELSSNDKVKLFQDHLPAALRSPSFLVALPELKPFVKGVLKHLSTARLPEYNKLKKINYEESKQVAMELLSFTDDSDNPYYGATLLGSCYAAASISQPFGRFNSFQDLSDCVSLVILLFSAHPLTLVWPTEVSLSVSQVLDLEFFHIRPAQFSRGHVDGDFPETAPIGFFGHDLYHAVFPSGRLLHFLRNNTESVNLQDLIALQMHLQWLRSTIDKMTSSQEQSRVLKSLLFAQIHENGGLPCFFPEPEKETTNYPNPFWPFLLNDLPQMKTYSSSLSFISSEECKQDEPHFRSQTEALTRFAFQGRALEQNLEQVRDFVNREAARFNPEPSNEDRETIVQKLTRNNPAWERIRERARKVMEISGVPLSGDANLELDRLLGLRVFNATSSRVLPNRFGNSLGSWVTRARDGQRRLLHVELLVAVAKFPIGTFDEALEQLIPVQSLLHSFDRFTFDWSEISKVAATNDQVMDRILEGSARFRHRFGKSPMLMETDTLSTSLSGRKLSKEELDKFFEN